MSLTSTDLQSFLTAHAIPGEILHLDVPTPTVDAAAQALGVRLGQVVKSILFLVEGVRVSEAAESGPKHDMAKPVLAITCGTAYVERRVIAAHFGVGRKQVRLASAEEVLEISGYEVGALPPFGHRQPLVTLLDRNVLDQPEVFAGGGDENAMLHLKPQDIVRLTPVVVMDLTVSQRPTHTFL